MRTLLVLSLTLTTTFSALGAAAETQYVTDSLMVPMRSGAGNEFRIINSRIKSGTAMQILESPAGDWAHVKLNTGVDGWIRKQYLQKTPVAQTQLASAQKKQADAEAKLAEQTALLTSLQAKQNELEQTSGRTEQQHAELITNYQNLKMLSEDAVNLNERYQHLLAEHEVLLTKHDALKAENDNLRNDQKISNGLYAVALVFAGMFAAVILPMFRRNKRYSDQIL